MESPEFLQWWFYRSSIRWVAHVHRMWTKCTSSISPLSAVSALYCRAWSSLLLYSILHWSRQPTTFHCILPRLCYWCWLCFVCCLWIYVIISSRRRDFAVCISSCTCSMGLWMANIWIYLHDLLHISLCNDVVWLSCYWNLAGIFDCEGSDFIWFSMQICTVWRSPDSEKHLP